MIPRTIALALTSALALPLFGCASGAPPAAEVQAAPPVQVSHDGPPLVYEAAAGPGGGRNIVLIAAEEEYRSEEALPQLAKILSQRHGFRCTVLFSTNPADGTIDPDARGHIPNLQTLEDADLVVIFTRFRSLPDDDMRFFADFVNRRAPIIGLRTATHAFGYAKDSTSPYADWSWDSTFPQWPGGFGQQLLGTTWVAHHGQHGEQSTRGVIPALGRGHAIMKGVKDIWGPTDVYAVSKLPDDATVLVEGSVLAGMTPDAPPVDGAVNDPRMPIAWIREIPLPAGGAQRTVCSTIGAAVDLQCEDLRRLLVNACYWCVGLGQDIPDKTNVDIVGTYEPTMFGFGGWKHGVRPQDLALPK